MTMPDERTRNLLQAGAFLKQLRADKSLPERVRNGANRLLRHYPRVNDVQLLANLESRFTGSNLLTQQFDPDWTKSYRLGAHTS